jgi:hypothetical protein
MIYQNRSGPALTAHGSLDLEEEFQTQIQIKKITKERRAYLHA